MANSFWGVIRRLIVGEPAFQNQPHSTDNKKAEHDNWDDSPVLDPMESKSGIDFGQLPPPKTEVVPLDTHGQKVIPEAYIVECAPKVHGDTAMDVWVTVRNSSSTVIEITSIELLGQKRSMSQTLGGGQERQILAYTGVLPTDNSQHTAYLRYKVSDGGDYFQADHTIHYDYDDEHKKYHPERLELVRPIRDV